MDPSEREALAAALRPIVERTHPVTARIRLNEDNRRWWTLAAMCFALFMIMLDNTVVNVALPSIQEDLNATLSGHRVDGERVHADLRRAARDRRPPGRHLRPAQDVPLRRGGLRAVEREHRTVPRPALARGRPRRPGRRRRVHDAGHPLDHHEHLPGRGARQGDRHLGRRVGTRARARPGGGRRAHRVRVLAGDLLPQPAGGRRRGGGHAVRRPASRATRAPSTGWTCRASRSSPWASRASCSPWWRATPGAGARPDRRPAGRRRDRPRRLRRLRAPGSRPDGGLHLLPLEDLRGREPGGLRRVVRDAGDVLLPRPLHAELARLLRGGGRRALPPLHADDRADRAAGRPAGRPRGPAAADRDRPHA